MANTTTSSSTAPATADAEQLVTGLPVRSRAKASAEAVRPIASVGPDLVRGVGEASKAVAYLESVADRDVTVSAITALECIGATQADALQAATDVLRFGDLLTVHGLLWARIAGPGPEEPWNYRVTLLVSAIDPDFGEADAPAHQAAPSPCRVILYLDVEDEVPENALTGVQREGLTQAGALQAAADSVRRCPELLIEGLLWARVPARRPGAWEYRLTVLACAGAPEHSRTGRPTCLDPDGPR